MKREKIIGIAAAAVCAVAVLAILLVCVLGRSGTPVTEEPADNVFLSGTTINGLDVSGLTPEEAGAALADRAKDYSCKVVLGEKTYTLTGEALCLTYRETADLQAFLDQQQMDPSRLAFTVEGMYTADMTALRTRLEADFPDPEPALPADEEGNTDPNAPKDAYLRFDEASLTYVIVPDVPVIQVDCGTVIDQVQTAVLHLEPEIVVDMEPFTRRAEITADNEGLTAALEEINSCLDLELIYSFTPTGDSTSYETVTREVLSRLYYVDEADLSIGVDDDALDGYVSELASKYSVSGRSVQFKTTGGSYLDIYITLGGQSVNSAALYDDLLQCLQSKTDGTRAAPYNAVENGNGYWNGSYVEVDLTSQTLWLYKNGQCILSCPIVSGCVADNTRTPTGCYAIYSMQTNRYLYGTNVDGTQYKEWVSYFMPFSGGYALHDATWRSTFGGTEYYYNGSHGCVGTSLSDAKTIYENVGIGTPVVIYGGISPSSLPPQELEIAQSDFAVSVEADHLTVGQTAQITVSGNATDPVITSSDSGVVLVEGTTVKAVGVGEATITVTCPAGSGYLEASQTITITVTEPALKTQDVSANDLTLMVGESGNVNASGQTAPQYTSQDPSVAAVDSEGTVTAVGPGETDIVITFPEGDGYQAAAITVHITVTAPEPEEEPGSGENP